MEVKVFIPSSVLTKIKESFLEYRGHEPTEAELYKFLENDILEVYYSHFEDGLRDAVTNGPNRWPTLNS